MIVAFAGRIASGKSAISKAVAEHFAVDRVSFGDAVRTEAMYRGLDTSRKVLQDLGDQLIAEGWDAFLRLVFAQAEWDGTTALIVDGVRHVAALNALRRGARGRPVYLVFIDAPPERRATWLAERGMTAAEAIAAEQHPNERQLSDVVQHADLVAVNDADLPTVVRQVVGAIDQAGGMTSTRTT